MVKDTALQNFWAPIFLKSKGRVIKKDAVGNVRFVLAIVLVAANAALLMSYIYGVNAFASQGYSITQLQQKISDLNDTNKTLTLQMSQATSMASIQNDFLSAGFVDAGTPQFLEVSEYASQSELSRLVSLSNPVPASP